MMEILKADGIAEKELISAMRTRAAEVSADIERSVAEIMCNVKENGLAAVEEYSLRFDKASPRELAKEELDAAYARCPKELIFALEHAAAIGLQRQILGHKTAFNIHAHGALGQVPQVTHTGFHGVLRS